MALTLQPVPFANNVYLHPPASMHELKLCAADSKLTVGHLNDEFQIKDPTLLQYYHLIQKVI